MTVEWKRGRRLPPVNAIRVGQEADGTPLYAARVRQEGSVHLGKFRLGFAGANVPIQGKEVALKPFEILVGEGRWAPARQGAIPAEAIPCGEETDGSVVFLARATFGGGLHPGELRAGSRGAMIPFGGRAFEVVDYEVLVAAGPERRPVEQVEPLLTWNFENTMLSGTSISVGTPSRPEVISGFVAQSGGGPAEVWGETGVVFLTRFLGTNEMFLWLSVTRPIYVESLTFRHWHNHNRGFPTSPSYRMHLQLFTGRGYQDVGDPLTLNNATSGTTDTIRIDRTLEPGGCKMRWFPKGLKRNVDTNTEFFAIKDLVLTGRVMT